MTDRLTRLENKMKHLPRTLQGAISVELQPINRELARLADCLGAQHAEQLRLCQRLSRLEKDSGVEPETLREVGAV